MNAQASDLKTKIRHQWCRLTEDELEQVHANADLLAGKLQERYGWAREEAERQVKDFSRRHCGSDRFGTHE